MVPNNQSFSSAEYIMEPEEAKFNGTFKVFIRINIYLNTYKTAFIHKNFHFHKKRSLTWNTI